MSHTYRVFTANPPRIKEEPPTARRELRLHHALRRTMKEARPVLGAIRVASDNVIETLAEIRSAEEALIEVEA